MTCAKLDGVSNYGILKSHNITVAHKPSNTQRDVLTKVKNPSFINSQTGEVYKYSAQNALPAMSEKLETKLRLLTNHFSKFSRH